MTETDKTKTFDLFGFLDGRAYPEDDVVVYTDEQSAYEVGENNQKIEDIRISLKNTGITDAERKRREKSIKDLEKANEGLGEKIKSTRLVFHMRGLPPEIINELSEKHNDSMDGTLEIMGAMIQWVTDAEGRRDSRLYDLDAVKALRGKIPPSSFLKMIEKTNSLLMASLAFNEMTDEGFLAKS